MPLLAKKSQRSNRGPISENQGLSYALRLLKVRPRSCFEVAQKLQARGLSGFQIDSIIVQLTEIKLLDDARFARDWVRWRDRNHPSGVLLLKHELREKGVSRDLIQKVLEEREGAEWRELLGVKKLDEPVDLILAKRLVNKRHTQFSDLSPEKRQQRLMGLLSRRGFSSNTIYSVIKTAE